MNKNIIIGILAVAVVGGIIIYAVNRSPASEPTTDDGTSTPAPTGNNNNTGNTAPVPGKPLVTTDAVISPTASTAVVNGKIYPNGAVTSYWFEYGTTPDGSNRTPIQILGSGYANIPTPAYITGLSSNTKYYFRLVAENIFGKVMGTQYAFQTTLAAAPAQGNAPTTRSNAATSVERATANLNGSVNPNGSQTSFWFEYGTSSDLGNITAFQSLSGSASNNVSISVSGLNPLTKYFFRINTQNQYGTVNGSILNFTTKGPVSPTEPTVNTDAASGVTRTAAQLNGRINPNGAATTYWFEYGTDSVLGNLIGTATVTSPIPAGEASVAVSTDIQDLKANTRYYIRLVGQNNQGIVKGDIENFRTNN